MADDALDGARRAFMEEMARFCEESGLPRMEGRLIGWLMVCSPPMRSADELAAELGASRGAISMAVRMLQRAGAVERVTVPGSRRHYYRFRPGFWRREIDTRVRQAETVRDMAEGGLKRLAGAPEGELERLRDFYEMYDFLAGEYAQVRDRWHEREQDRTRQEEPPR
ncbi:GbsR/MarR family transcriptional regulator [Allonocardiopsis opalescens]|uniref:MarR family protein n=1 Tax=Allonocardiopsis opalescens TaxID=1144618 RepID=A0A2T0Q2T1_9ACTN|nr:MarR family transcriptional regulator [Allonocardiopsis opalescens]PRX97978.1 MarR family protein [Allonocardiopsis opalescens]